MECKCLGFTNRGVKARIKVEPYWNVNRGVIIGYCFIEDIKVEPYWNVNMESPNSLSYLEPIKVEPYWNVNLELRLYIVNANTLK